MKAHPRFLPALLLVAAFVLVAPLRATAQGASELDTLKSAVSNMEKTILELKQQIRQLEQRHAPATAVAPVTAPATAPAAVPAVDQTIVPDKRQPGDDLADRTSPMRHRETIAGDNLAAPRPGNAPIDPSYAGFMPLFGSKTWVKLGGYSLILWWAIIGGLIMTYLYSVAGLAYLHEDFLKTGKIPSGVAVPIQMATIAQGVLGPMAGWLMLLFIMVTLYDAQFPIYDTFIGRTTCDAIAVTGRARRPYRFYYFVVVTAAVAAGFYLITVAQPFILWIGVAISALVYRSIGAWQILLLNNRRLPDGFKVSKLNTWLLWITVVTGLGGVGTWAVTVLPGEIAKRFGG